MGGTVDRQYTRMPDGYDTEAPSWIGRGIVAHAARLVKLGGLFDWRTKHDAGRRHRMAFALEGFS